ncbi:protein NDUFAF4 homolog [Zophobas morio]|uniref:protein NDUFAF4 homolog n=1 Tax=Zophobas morio TaxID=2755281 RepID=UPI00308396B4
MYDGCFELNSSQKRRKMGKILSLMGRPLRNFNVESRAHKIISQEKPVPAPKHKSDQLIYDEIMKNHPEGSDETQIKHVQLDKYLKDVYVKSHDPNPPQKAQTNPDRPLPLNRHQVEEYEYGFKEPDKIPIGKTTLRQALQFITDHHNDSKLHTPQKIAQDYQIPEESIKNILKYYRVFEVYIPEQRKVKAKFAGPSVPRIKVTAQPKKQLSSGKDKDDT